MRDIKFRGKRLDTNEWVFGSLWTNAGSPEKYCFHAIIHQWEENDCEWASYAHPVNPNTVGQFTGLKDKYKEEIYEGDVVTAKDYDEESAQWLDDITPIENCPTKEIVRDVVTMERFPGFWLQNERFGNEGEKLVPEFKCELIGNIHDNPELIEG